ncbi:hypothetical protein [Mucilaginibacter sp. MD40]|uniref:hypothetical protein n=1 Tax=Mucilaginibacter sp. MD40 TaxID=2029590 RepID=UPI001E28B31F|nr:hypothetical protein [Mucilaginibacter sp. MD40]
MKKQLEKNRQKKKEDKAQRKQERKESGSSAEEIAYVDEFGNLTSTPPTQKQASRDEDKKN